jgi:hypothetical protein
MINPKLLLFIEPKEYPSEEPLIDSLTRKMTSSFRRAKKGMIHRYSVIGEPYEFEENEHGYDGWHNCSCGANAGGNDYLLPNGEMTNGNCIHYLAYHREEISQEQLDRVNKLSDGEEVPVEDEIEGDRKAWFPLMYPDREKEEAK